MRKTMALIDRVGIQVGIIEFRHQRDIGNDGAQRTGRARCGPEKASCRMRNVDRSGSEKTFCPFTACGLGAFGKWGGMTDLKREACYIGGHWRSGTAWTCVDDPASGSAIGRVPTMGAAEAEEAVAEAARALPDWAGRTAAERASVLRAVHDSMMARIEELAGLLTAEQGKPLAESRAEIAYAASFFEWFAEEGKRAYGEIIPAHARDRRLVVLRQPIGVVGIITPWNFPSAMIARKLAPALAAGCTAVVKPAEQTPFSALAIAAICEAAGIPGGAVNVITGHAKEIGEVLTSSPIVRKMSFTGSTSTGARLYAQSAATIKKLSLELGGNAPFVVFPDADIEAAIEGAIQSKFRNAGQTCVCTNRFLVHAEVHDEFVSKLAERVRGLCVGAGTLDGVDVGPMIDCVAVARVRTMVDEAVSAGAVVALGGGIHPAGKLFLEPTVISGVTADMRIAREEIFGPVATVRRFESEEEALKAANETEFGLAAYVFTRDLSRSWRMIEGLEAGMVGLNTGLLSTEVAPFGGIKQSGLGREGSRHGLEDYMELKYACLAI